MFGSMVAAGLHMQITSHRDELLIVRVLPATEDVGEEGWYVAQHLTALVQQFSHNMHAQVFLGRC